jgi:hypothetical protein
MEQHEIYQELAWLESRLSEVLENLKAHNSNENQFNYQNSEELVEVTDDFMRVAKEVEKIVYTKH